MSKLRIASALVLAAIAGALTVGAAAAQTTGSEPAGQPLALLAGLRPPHATTTHELHAHRTKTMSHAGTANGASKKTAAATRMKRTALAGNTGRTVAAPPPAANLPVQTASDALPENSAQTPQTAPPQTALPSLAAAADNALAPAPDAVAADSQPVSGSVVVDGQTVEVAPPDQVNAIDLAADDHRDAAAMVADHDDAAAPAVRTVLAAPARQYPGAVGSVSWMAQILAALGGAVAAGAVAWFLIGSGPQRMYG